MSSFRVFASCVEYVTNSKPRTGTISDRDLFGNYKLTHASHVSSCLGSCQGFNRYSCLLSMSVNELSSRPDAEYTE